MRTFGQLCSVGLLVSVGFGYIGFAAVFTFFIILSLILIHSNKESS